MFISNFDFLSSPPQIYFLGKRTNKTIFGGILFLIYIIIMIVITIFYILDYYLNDKYDIRYSLYKNFQEDLNINVKNDLNYNFTFSMDMIRVTQDLESDSLNEKFLLLDSNFSVIEENTMITKTNDEMIIYIAYFCISNCSYENDIDIAYLNNISYNGYKLDHQSDKIPLETNNNYISQKSLYFSFKQSTLFQINFELIRYKEELGLLGLFERWLNLKKEYSCIDILSIDKETAERTIDINLDEHFEGQYKILSIIKLNKHYEQIVEYIRLKKSPLDVLANIGSLFYTFFTLFCFIFNFYSRNYNNYKIMRELLTNPKLFNNSNNKISHSKTIIFENITFRNKRKNYPGLDKQSIDTSKSVPFKSNDIKISNKYLEKKEESFQLPRINVIHFLLKHLNFKSKYMKKCRDIIDMCNNILFKYISVEVLLYNHIIFENFLKDYKWNEPFYSRLSSNDLVKKLKLKS